MSIDRALGICVAAALVAHAHGARAQEADGGPGGGGKSITCQGELGDTRVDGDVNVVGRCTLNGTEVRGDVTMFSGGSLTAREARIRGNLEGSRADFVDLVRSRVDGRLRLEALVGDRSVIELTEVHGNLELTANRSKFDILNNELGSDLQATLNTGGLVIAGNAIVDDLICFLNVPAPTGIGNAVGGDAEGQCANLESDTPAPAPAPTPTPAPTPAPAPAPTPTPAPTPAPAPAPPAASPPTTELAPDEGGAGAMGWPIVFLLPLVAWRRWRDRPAEGSSWRADVQRAAEASR